MRFVKLWGGLGNQLFQYAFALYLEKNLNEQVSFFTVDTGIKDRTLDLKKLIGDLNLLTPNDLRKYFYLSGSGFEYRIERKAVQILPWLNRQFFVEPDLRFIKNIPPKASLFDGYWQSFKYVESISKFLEDHLHLTGILNVNDDTVLKIKKSNSVAVHLRRGDYLFSKQKEIYVQCSSEYYKNAFDIITKRTNNPVFFIFSDNIEQTAEFFDHSTNIVNVDSRGYSDPPLRDLQLMSMCRHNIIANSTFSWWAAWLNSNPDKIVIAPKKWYNGKLNEFTDDLIPDKWIRV